MPKSALRYSVGAVIVHGKSELLLVKYITTNLHLPIKIIARDNGRSSIQINGLKAFLDKNPYNDLKAFAKEYNVEYDRKNKRLKNFKIFVIMDTDDCNDAIKESYISGRLFKGHPLEEYIVPVFNTPNLEEVMKKANIITKQYHIASKGTYYSRIFPINTQPLSHDTINQVKTFADKVKGIRDTNILEFIDYCIEKIPA